MAPTDRDLVAILNELLEACQDGADSLRAAVGDVTNDGVKRLLAAYAQQRTHYAVELQTEVGRLRGPLRNGWTRVKVATTTNGDERSAVARCEREESAAEKRYRKALTRDLPAAVQ